MFANLLHLIRRMQPGYDQRFVKEVEAVRKPPRNRRLERQIWISWVLIAVKSVLVVWIIRHFHIPFSPLWVIVPTVAFGALYTVVYCRRS